MKKILVVGLFLSDKNKTKIARSAADQLATLLEGNDFPVIRTSTYAGRVKRLVDTLSTIFSQRKNYDIAIVPLYGGFKSYIWEETSTRLLKLLGKKIVLIIHGGYIPDRIKKSPKKYITSISRADVVVCPSNFIISVLKNYGLKSLLIENVLHLNDYLFQEKKTFRPKLFWMRTFEDVYNPLMAVEVLAAFKKLYPEASMVMAGYDRGMFQQTVDLAKALNVYDSIDFPGYISRDQKNQYASDNDIYICTNMVDNAPITLVEMMMMGMPVITVDSGGIPFMVTHNYNGKMVKYNDVDAMVNEIDSLIKNPEEGVRIIKSARLYAHQYDALPVMEKWVRLFEQLGHIKTKYQ